MGLYCLLLLLPSSQSLVGRNLAERDETSGAKRELEACERQRCYEGLQINIKTGLPLANTIWAKVGERWSGGDKVIVRDGRLSYGLGEHRLLKIGSEGRGEGKKEEREGREWSCEEFVVREPVVLKGVYATERQGRKGGKDKNATQRRRRRRVTRRRTRTLRIIIIRTRTSEREKKRRRIRKTRTKTRQKEKN